MSEIINVLVVDDLEETRSSVVKMLQFDDQIEVIAEAVNGREAIEMAQKHHPDVVLMDVNMPDMDGITATRAITEVTPAVQIIIMSVQSDTPYMRKAMIAGARDFLMKPFSLDDLHRAVHQVYAGRPHFISSQETSSDGSLQNGTISVGKGKIFAVYSPKGGNGCSTVAVNTALSLAQKGHSTLLVDGSFQFGSIAVMLNMKPNSTIFDLIERMDELDADLVRGVAQNHGSGLAVLLAPRRPELADTITVAQIEELMQIMRQIYDYIIFDTSSALDDKTMTILDRADQILLVTDQELTTLKTTRDLLNLLHEMEYESDKLMLTINRVSRHGKISVQDVTSILKRSISFSIPEDLDMARKAIEQGMPLLLTLPGKHPLAKAYMNIGEQLAQGSEDGSEYVNGDREMPAKRSFLDRLLRRQ